MIAGEKKFFSFSRNIKKSEVTEVTEVTLLIYKDLRKPFVTFGEVTAEVTKTELDLLMYS